MNETSAHKPVFEPFGETVNQLDSVPTVSRRLERAGVTVFWSLVIAIVAARAVFFDPSIYANFARIASLLR